MEGTVEGKNSRDRKILGMKQIALNVRCERHAKAKRLRENRQGSLVVVSWLFQVSL